MYVPHLCRNGCKVMCSRDKTGTPCPNCGSPLASLDRMRAGSRSVGNTPWSTFRKLRAAFGFLILIVLVVLWIFFTPPKAVRNALNQMDPAQTPDPAARVEAVRTVLKFALQDPNRSGWQQLQKKACIDPDASVRVAAVKALGEFADAKPEYVVVDGGVGKGIFIDCDAMAALGRSDPAPEVRSAVAEFWVRADVFGKNGLKNLEEMIAAESDPARAAALRAALARRLERSLARNDLDANAANEIRSRCKLP